VARRPSTTEPRRIGVPSTNNFVPLSERGFMKPPFEKIPLRKEFLQRPLSIEQRRPPTIEEQVAQVLSGPSFPGRQMPKVPQQPMRMAEPVGPMTDMRTMPSMPTTGIASLSDVLPLLDMGGEDIMQLLSDLPKTPSAPVMPISGSQIVDDDPNRYSYVMREDPEEMIARKLREMEENALNMPKLTTDPIPDPITGDRYPLPEAVYDTPIDIFAEATGNFGGGGLPTPEDFETPMMEEEMVFDGIVRGEPVDPEKWAEAIGVPLTPEQKEMINQSGFSIEDWNTPIDIIDPRPIPGADPMTSPEQKESMGMIEQLQQMIADMQAQQQEQAATRAAQEKEMTQNYMVPTSRMGYNPYLSGQYQSDPYGPSGVPNMGGITTIPVPGGYGIYNPIYGG
jgi:hypothetical protein